MKKLDPNKSHDHEMLSTRILKLCAESVYQPFNLLFKSCLETGQYLSEWKQANAVSVFKKGGIQLLKIVIEFLYFPSLVKFLKDNFTINCLGFLLEITSLVLNQAILVL